MCRKCCLHRLTSPGLGKVGASLGVIQSFYQGFPCTDRGERRIKGAIFAANIYEKLGLRVVPNGSESRHDIIQAVAFHNPDAVAFCGKFRRRHRSTAM